MAKKKAQKKKASRPASKTYTIHLLSAATGDLISGLASVAVTQFPDADFEIVSHPLQKNLEKLTATLENLTGDRPFVLHALADAAAKQLVRNKCVVHNIPHFDVTGSFVNFVSDCVGLLPENDVSRLHQLDTAYQHRIEAMEFVMEHDDSLGLNSLHEADIVIVGVSRVSKSPTALYLGSRGFKVANVSITSEVGFPSELEEISQKHLVAFTTQPKHLHEVRKERARRMGTEGTAYEDLNSVIHEVMEVEAEYRRRGYPIIDITSLTIEQTSARILEILKLRPK